MTELQRRFFKRVDLPEKYPVTFDDVPEIQRAMAMAIPFENLDIIDGRLRPVTRENLEEKILVRRRGGLCYELNTTMYFFLRDCGFDVHLVSGTVRKLTGEWTDDNGHVTIVMTHNWESYIIESGFGSFLPMTPVPFSGEIIKSASGEFRVLEQTTEKGTHILEMRNTQRILEGASSQDWLIGYAFSLPEIDETRLNDAQTAAAENESSPFNKSPVIVKRTDNGHISLTPDTLTRTVNGERTKEPISQTQYAALLKGQFGLV